MSVNQVVRLNLSTGGIAAAGPQLRFAFTGALEAASGRLWLGTDRGPSSCPRASSIRQAGLRPRSGRSAADGWLTRLWAAITR